MGFDPRLWGHLYWFFIHSGSYYYITKKSDEHNLVHIQNFFLDLPNYLPCPGCKQHATMHIMNNYPKFDTFEKVWEYGINFHNQVNRRNGKLIYSTEDAKQMLINRLQEFKLTVDELENAFLQDYFTVLIFTTYTYYNVHSDDNAPDILQEKYKNFLLNIVYLFPFGQKITSLNETCRDIMKTFINSEEFKVANQQEAETSITSLYNHICTIFNCHPVSKAEMRNRFTQYFINFPQVQQQEQSKREDAKKIRELQERVQNLQNKEIKSSWKWIAIPFIILTSLLLLFVLIQKRKMRKMKKNTRQNV